MAWEGTERICLAAAGWWWSLDSAVINQASCNQPPDRYSTNRKYKLFLPSMLGQDGFIITFSNQTERLLLLLWLQFHSKNIPGLGVKVLAYEYIRLNYEMFELCHN